MHGRSGFLSRDAVRIGAVVAFLVAVAVATAWIRFGRSFPFENDAQIFLRIATDPFGDGSALAGLRADTGTAYRYGRILYPLLAWIVAAGRSGLVEWTMPVVYSLSVGAMVACACQLAKDAGAQPASGLFVLVTPAYWLTAPVLFSEPLVVALLLATYVFFLRARLGAAVVAAGFLLLAREAMVIALLPLVWASWRGSPRRAIVWAWSLAPIAIWWTWIRMRVGDWPPLDPAYGRRGALSWPLGGPITVLRENGGADDLFIVAMVLLIATAVAAVIVYRRRPSILASGGAVLSAFAFLFGAGAWRIPGAAIRLLLPAQALLIVAWLTARVREPRIV